MKKTLILTTLCLLIVLSGCENKNNSEIIDQAVVPKTEIKKVNKEDNFYAVIPSDEILVEDNGMFTIPLGLEIKNKDSYVTGFSLEVNNLPNDIKEITEKDIILKGVNQKNWQIQIDPTAKGFFVRALGLNDPLKESQNDFVKINLKTENNNQNNNLETELILADSQVPAQSHEFYFKTKLLAK